MALRRIKNERAPSIFIITKKNNYVKHEHVIQNKLLFSLNSKLELYIH